MQAANDVAGGGKSPSNSVDSSHHRPIGGTAAYAAELIGTFTLVLFIILVLSVFAQNPTSAVGSPASTVALGYVDWSVIGLVHTFVLLIIVVSIGIVSGAHVNPAITLGMLSRRLISPADAGIYIVMQVIGALLAALLVKLILSGAASSVDYGSPRIVEDMFLEGSRWKGLIAEAIGAFFLMWAIMATVINPRTRLGWAGLAIGAALGLGVFVFGPITGASFNPARAFAPLIVSGEFGSFWDFLVAYVLGPIIGASLAAYAYTAIVLAPSEARETSARKPIAE